MKFIYNTYNLQYSVCVLKDETCMYGSWNVHMLP